MMLYNTASIAMGLNLREVIVDPFSMEGIIHVSRRRVPRIPKGKRDYSLGDEATDLGISYRQLAEILETQPK